MPTAEKRLDSLEEELNLVKGEIQRTLVDLRTVTLQADAPFGGASRISRRDGGLDVREIRASISTDELKDPEKSGAALLDGPATGPQEDVILQPSEGTPHGVAPKQASESGDGYDIRRVQQARNPGVSPNHAGQERMGPPVSLDVNLIASLVRWVCIARERLGAHWLEGFLELYTKATNQPPGVKELIMYLSSMVGNSEVSREANPRESNIAQEWNDLMLQLHGILTAHCTSPIIPNLDLPGVPVQFPISGNVTNVPNHDCSSTTEPTEVTTPGHFDRALEMPNHSKFMDLVS
jgi:hypothetical protein